MNTQFYTKVCKQRVLYVCVCVCAPHCEVDRLQSETKRTGSSFVLKADMNVLAEA